MQDKELQIAKLQDELKKLKKELRKLDREKKHLESQNELLVATNKKAVSMREFSERELVRAKEQAEQADRAKTDFLINISHEIRTPLNAILGMNEMIIRESGQKQIREYAEDLENSGRTMLTMINDMVNFSKLTSGIHALLPSEEVPDPEQYTAAKPVMKKRTGTLLVVDDVMMNCKVFCGLLKNTGLIIDTAGSGFEALEKCRKTKYDLIFMDHMMPQMDGIECLYHLRQDTASCNVDTPVIVLTANALTGMREKYLGEGFSDYLTKPVSGKSLQDMIRKYIPDLPAHEINSRKFAAPTAKEQAETVVSTALSVKEQENLNAALVAAAENHTKSTTAATEEVQPGPTATEEVQPEPAAAEAAPQADIRTQLAFLDVDTGLSYCMEDEDFYKEILESYLAEPKLEVMTKLFEAEDWKEYRVVVHALKSTSLSIGAVQLSEHARELETAAKELDEAFLKAHHADTCLEYEKLLNQLETALHHAESRSFEENPSARNLEMQAAEQEPAGQPDNRTEQEPASQPDNRTEQEPEGQPNNRTSQEPEGQPDNRTVQDIAQQRLEKLQDDIELAGANILVVDDDAVNIRMAEKMLSKKHTVITAASGNEALGQLRKNSIDLVLLDIHMPGMDGHQVLKEIRAEKKYDHIPVIFLTADDDASIEARGFDEGAMDFIRKPFDQTVATKRIERILELAYLQRFLRKEVARQTEKAEKRRIRVQKMSDQLVQALGNSIDAKDRYTKGHSTRVAMYSVMLGEKMGYDTEALKRLEYIGMLHDIGKIGIPDTIINKTSGLTDEEYAYMKNHPMIGYEILKEITEIEDISIGARWHHERVDGKGYPDHLKGDEIPEIARIIGVADAYDAMTSKRSYRDVLPQEVVRGEIEKGRGTQFDERIADKMLELIDEDTEYQLHE